MTEKSKKYNEILKATRHRAIELLKLCEDAEEGKISGEEFEKRITKSHLIAKLPEEAAKPWG